MDQKHLLTQALGFLQAQRRHRWWLRTVTGMAAMVVFVTTYLLILPAITMENSIFDVTAEPPEASLGERIHSEVYLPCKRRRQGETGRPSFPIWRPACTWSPATATVRGAILTPRSRS